MMRLTLEAVGYQVDEAGDGQAGLDRVREEGPYDAIVLDQKMPGIDGLETLSTSALAGRRAEPTSATSFTPGSGICRSGRVARNVSADSRMTR